MAERGAADAPGAGEAVPASWHARRLLHSVSRLVFRPLVSAAAFVIGLRLGTDLVAVITERLNLRALLAAPPADASR